MCECDTPEALEAINFDYHLPEMCAGGDNLICEGCGYSCDICEKMFCGDCRRNKHKIGWGGLNYCERCAKKSYGRSKKSQRRCKVM